MNKFRWLASKCNWHSNILLRVWPAEAKQTLLVHLAWIPLLKMPKSEQSVWIMTLHNNSSKLSP